VALEHGTPAAIALDGESHEVTREEVELLRRATGALVVKEEGGFFAAIDPEITPELRREGLARELVSRVQQMRKAARFAVSDRIRLRVSGDAEIETVVRGYQEYIAADVLATDVAIGGGAGDTPDAVQDVELEGSHVRIALTRVH
jgi:isoleucyl-tRNA synthetase